MHQVPSQVFKIMACWFHAYEHNLGLNLFLGLVYGVTELVVTPLEYVNFKRMRHDLSQGIVTHRRMKVLADV